MNTPRTYQRRWGRWIDVEVADVEAAAKFYAVLFGWTYLEATAPGSRLRYLIAQLDGQDVAGIGQLSATDDFPNRPGNMEHLCRRRGCRRGELHASRRPVAA